MVYGLSFKNLILLILAWVIIVGGLFFDVHETLEHSNMFSLSEDCSDSQNLPSKNSLYISSGSSFIISVSEVRDVRIIKEVIKQLEKGSKGNYILILACVLCFLLAASSICSSQASSLFKWTSIIFSRRSIICYIHNQDGNK